MIVAAPTAEAGTLAPDFFLDSAAGPLSLHQLAARYHKLVITTQDSYRYHPN